MTPDDIFELARKKTPPPDNLDLPQRMLYSIARNLYQSFGANILSLEQAREEKKQAIRAYNDYHHAELEAKRLRLVRHRPGSPVSLILLSCRKGGKPGLAIEEAALYHPDGSKTAYYQALYHT